MYLCVKCVQILLICETCYGCWFVFFFKQKTAYEMRISDWSSDVCSSDLRQFYRAIEGAAGADELRETGRAHRRTDQAPVRGRTARGRQEGRRARRRGDRKSVV